MSIPSSSVEVATSALSSPALSASSIRCRSSRAIEPWWARAISSPARSLSAVASRSASRRAFTNRIVERCARTSSSSRGCIAGQMLRVSPAAAAGPSAGAGSASPGRDMSSTGTSTRRSKAFVAPASTIVTGRGVHLRTPTPPPRKRATSSSGRCVAESPIRCSGCRVTSCEPLQGQREVSAALRPDDRVDLVHDHRLDRGQERPRARREDEEQRLGRRDQDVGRVPQHAGAVLRGRVAGPDRHDRHVDRFAAPLGHARDARERHAQVLLDVHRQRLERRDVEHPAAVGVLRHWREQQPVDGGKERRERLARARGREDQRALAAVDRRPRQALRACRGCETSRRTTPRQKARRAARASRGSPAHHRGAMGRIRPGPGTPDARS